MKQSTEHIDELLDAAAAATGRALTVADEALSYVSEDIWCERSGGLGLDNWGTLAVEAHLRDRADEASTAAAEAERLATALQAAGHVACASLDELRKARDRAKAAASACLDEISAHREGA